MSQILPINSDCCTTCDETTSTVNVPGARGPAGLDGSDGTNGVNAFTFVSTAFVIPAVAANVNIVVLDNRWMAVGQILFIALATAGGLATPGGYFQVVTVNGADQTLATVKNLGYAANGAAGSTVLANTKISPAGCSGEDGSSPAPGDYLDPANNLSDVDNAGTSRTNLGLGTMAVAAAADYVAVASIGTTVEAHDDILTALAGLAAAADKLPYMTGAAAMAMADFGALARTLLACTTAAAMRAAIVAGSRYGLLGSLRANFNLQENIIPIVVSTPGSIKYIIRKITVVYYNINLNTAVGGIYTAAGKTGNTIVGAAQTYTDVSAANKFLDLTLDTGASGATKQAQVSPNLYLYLDVLQGGAGSADVYVWGEDLS